jgi:hypothetical protein
MFRNLRDSKKTFRGQQSVGLKWPASWDMLLACGGTRAQRLRCHATGSRPVEKDKNDPTTANRCTLTLYVATFMPFTSVVK